MSAAHLARQTTTEAEDTVIRAVIQVAAEAADHFKLIKKHLKRRYFVKKFLRFFYLSEKGTLHKKCSFRPLTKLKSAVIFLQINEKIVQKSPQIWYNKSIEKPHKKREFNA